MYWTLECTSKGFHHHHQADHISQQVSKFKYFTICRKHYYTTIQWFYLKVLRINCEIEELIEIEELTVKFKL